MGEGGYRKVAIFFLKKSLGMFRRMDPHKEGGAAQPPEKSGAGNKQPSHQHGEGK
ncbi:MAG: hypothetical protein AB1773_12960 [Pseudomonadota bacterium]